MSYDETKLGDDVLRFLAASPSDPIDQLGQRAARLLVDTATMNCDDGSMLALARMLAHSTLFLISRKSRHYPFVPAAIENRTTVDVSGQIGGFAEDQSGDPAHLLATARSRVEQAERIVQVEVAGGNIGRRDKDNNPETDADAARIAFRAIIRETGKTDVRSARCFARSHNDTNPHSQRPDAVERYHARARKTHIDLSVLDNWHIFGKTISREG
jgi:hypothetical protein